MTLVRMKNWINKLLQTFSARLMITQGEVKIELLGNILNLIHRKNPQYIKDSRNLLGLNRNVEKKVDDDVDPFIDDIPVETVVQKVIHSRQKKPKRVIDTSLLDNGINKDYILFRSFRDPDKMVTIEPIN